MTETRSHVREIMSPEDLAAYLGLGRTYTLDALRQAALLAGVPFAIIMIFMCYALYKGIRAYFREQVGQEGSEEVAAEPAGRAAKEPAG